MSATLGLPPIRREVLALSPYQPGKPVEEVERELGIAEAVKLASNENCLGPSPRALEAGREALLRGVHLYPDGGSFYLRERLAELHRLPPEQVFIGSGTTEIIQLLSWVLLGAGSSAVYAAQSFVMYALAVQAAAGRGIAVALDAAERHDLGAMAAAVSGDTRLVFVANPNNPTGTHVGKDAVALLLDRLPAGVALVLDEAYREYVAAPDYPDGAEFLRRGRPVVVLRTFSKVHGLAGMRIGYALGPAPLVDALHRVRSPFNVTGPAQAMALAALDDDDHVKRSHGHNRAELAFLGEELGRSGFPFTPSQANFVLVDVGVSAELAFRRLLGAGVIVRPMAGYGFPTRIRVTVGTRSENQRFLAALPGVLGPAPAPVPAGPAPASS